MTKAPKSLQGKTALVTGATGGVGGELAKALVREGAKVALADLDQARLDAAAAALGGDTLALALDVSDAEAFTRAIDEVERTLGPLEILCNVAGIMPLHRFDEEPARITRQILGVNLDAVIASTQEAGRRMKRRGSGHIVNVASGGGWLAGAGVATYCASKFGVVGYSESVAMELRGTGVAISVIAPAVIKTQLSAGIKDVRGVRAVEPAEVAEAIVDVLKRPRFAVFVPKPVGVMALSFSALPYRLRHFLAHVSRTDQLFLTADMRARSAYENAIAQAAAPATNGAATPSSAAPPRR